MIDIYMRGVGTEEGWGGNRLLPETRRLTHDAECGPVQRLSGQKGHQVELGAQQGRAHSGQVGLLRDSASPPADSALTLL